MHQKDDTTRPPDADDRLGAGASRRRYRLATPLSLAIALGCMVAIAGFWLVTLQRVAFEREQALQFVQGPGAYFGLGDGGALDGRQRCPVLPIRGLGRRADGAQAQEEQACAGGHGE